MSLKTRSIKLRADSIYDREHCDGGNGWMTHHFTDSSAEANTLRSVGAFYSSSLQHFTSMRRVDSFNKRMTSVYIAYATAVFADLEQA